MGLLIITLSILIFAIAVFFIYKEGYNDGKEKGLEIAYKSIDKVLDDYFKYEENENEK